MCVSLDNVNKGLNDHLNYCFLFVAGKGGMAEVSTIVSVVKQYLQKPDESSQKT